VKDNPITTSDMITTNCSVTVDTGATGKDRLTYSGIVNVLGQDNFALSNSAVSFRLGGISVNGTLNKGGSFRGTLAADLSKVSMRISPRNGQFTVSISKGSFAGVMNTKSFVAGSNTPEALGVVVGDAVATTEVLGMATKQTGTKTTLTYRLGRAGSNLGGSFQIVSTRGKDAGSATGIAGDSWNVNFIAMPRLGVAATGQGVDNVSSAEVNIGTKFFQRLPNGSTKPTTFSFRGDSASLIKSAKLDARTFKGNVTTAGLAASQTGLPSAAQAPSVGNVFFSLGVYLTRTGATFSGEHARRVFGLRNTYSDTPPR
jgi:hypothetical protein